MKLLAKNIYGCCKGQDNIKKFYSLQTQEQSPSVEPFSYRSNINIVLAIVSTAERRTRIALTYTRVYIYTSYIQLF